MFEKCINLTNEVNDASHLSNKQIVTTNDSYGEIELLFDENVAQAQFNCKKIADLDDRSVTLKEV